jgi:hypothetical protein
LDISSFRQLLKTPINTIAYSKGVGDACLEKMRDIIRLHTNVECNINQMLSKSNSIVSIFNPTLYSGFLEKLQIFFQNCQKFGHYYDLIGGVVSFV